MWEPKSSQSESRTCMLNPIPNLAKPNMALEHIETGAKVPSGGLLTKVQSPSQSNPWKGVQRKYCTVDKEVFETGHAEERNQNWRWKVWLCYDGTTGDIHSFITIDLIKSYPILPGPSRMACWIAPVDGGFCILPELLYRRGLTTFFSIHECGTQMWPPPLGTHGQAGPTFPLPFLPHSRPSSLKACLTQGPWPQELASFLEVLKRLEEVTVTVLKQVVNSLFGD